MALLEILPYVIAGSLLIYPAILIIIGICRLFL